MVGMQTLKSRANIEAGVHWCSLEQLFQKISKLPIKTSVAQF